MHIYYNKRRLEENLDVNINYIIHANKVNIIHIVNMMIDLILHWLSVNLCVYVFYTLCILCQTLHVCSFYIILFSVSLCVFTHSFFVLFSFIILHDFFVCYVFSMDCNCVFCLIYAFKIIVRNHIVIDNILKLLSHDITKAINFFNSPPPPLYFACILYRLGWSPMVTT